MREGSMIYEFLRYPPARRRGEDAWWESCADLLLHVDNQFCTSRNLIIRLQVSAPGSRPRVSTLLLTALRPTLSASGNSDNVQFMSEPSPAPAVS